MHIQSVIVWLISNWPGVGMSQPRLADHTLFRMVASQNEVSIGIRRLAWCSVTAGTNASSCRRRAKNCAMGRKVTTKSALRSDATLLLHTAFGIPIADRHAAQDNMSDKLLSGTLIRREFGGSAPIESATSKVSSRSISSV